MKKLFIIITLTLLFTKAYAINNSCKEVNDDGLGTAFAVMNGLSYMKGIADVKNIQMDMSESLRDDFEKYLKSKCDEDKYNRVHEISLNYFFNYINHTVKNKVLTKDELFQFTSRFFKERKREEMGEDKFSRLITCLVNNYSQETHNYIIKNNSRIQILYNQKNAGRDEKSNYEGEWFDESFMNNLEINYEKCIK